MPRFMHVGIAFDSKPKIDGLNSVMTALSDDWIRYAGNNWILWTDKSAQNITDELKKHLDSKDQFLVVRLDIYENQGWLKQWIWDWLNKPRSSNPALSGFASLGLGRGAFDDEWKKK